MDYIFKKQRLKPYQWLIYLFTKVTYVFVYVNFIEELHETSKWYFAIIKDDINLIKIK